LIKHDILGVSQAHPPNGFHNKYMRAQGCTDRRGAGRKNAPSSPASSMPALQGKDGDDGTKGKGYKNVGIEKNRSSSLFIHNFPEV